MHLVQHWFIVKGYHLQILHAPRSFLVSDFVLVPDEILSRKNAQTTTVTMVTVKMSKTHYFLHTFTDFVVVAEIIPILTFKVNRASHIRQVDGVITGVILGVG